MPRRSIGWWAMPVALASMVNACGSTTTESTAPTAKALCQVSLTLPPVPSTGTVLNAPLAASRDCLWSAQADVEWLSVTPSSGQGDAVVAVVVGANPEGRTRAGRLLINDQPFALVQDPSPCRFDVAPRQMALPHHGGRASAQVTTLPGCVWQVSIRDTWIRAVAGQQGESTGVVELVADGNAGSARIADMQVAGVALRVSQPAGPGDHTQCRFSLSIGAADFTAAGGNGAVELHTVSGCVWGAASTQPWIIVNTGVHATATGVVQYTVQPNTSAVRREGAILAGGRRHVVRQASGSR